MEKVFKSVISAAYGSNMNHIVNYGKILPSAKKKLKIKENVSEGSLNSKFELAKKYYIYGCRIISTHSICSRYKLNSTQSKILYKMLKDFKTKYENNVYGAKINQNTVKSEPKRIIPTLEERLSNIQIRYLSEDRSRNNVESIPEGFVYMIENPAYPGWIKVGMTIDYEDRLLSYNNTYDPHRMFSYVDVRWVKDRKNEEINLLNLFESKADKRNGKWFKIDKSFATRLFVS